MEKLLYSVLGSLVFSIIITFPLLWFWNGVVIVFGFSSMTFWQMFSVCVLVRVVDNIINKCK